MEAVATQEELYADIDLDLSWSERALPERVRTKHVHRLHPYLGKFIPQLVEVLLDRHLVRGQRVLDPFAGSGTTLVQALESGLEATGSDVAAFNCLLMRVKTRRYEPFGLEAELRDCLRRFERGEGEAGTASRFVRDWYAPRAAEELLRFRSLAAGYVHEDVLRVVLSRAARSARRTTHFDLDFPRRPQREPYWCHKHRRECRPVEEAAKFLRRYTLDTLVRLQEFGRVRGSGSAEVLHGDARSLELGGPFDAVLTSPPYPGLIDYHEQHRYAYELLRLDDRRELELGAAAAGVSRAAIAAYSDGMAAVLANAVAALRPRGARARRRRRPPRPLPGDPRTGRARARDHLPPPRQPADRAAERRVLRGRARRARPLVDALLLAPALLLPPADPEPGDDLLHLL